MTLKSEYPLVSIVILNYNGLKWLNECLSSILSSNYPCFEVIFVDNGSTDGSLEFVKKKFGSKITLVKNQKNFGFAKGNNIGASFSRKDSKYLIFLNNDTKVSSNWLKELVSFMEKHPEAGAAQPLSLHYNSNKIDSLGVGSINPSLRNPFEVFYAEGLCLITRKKIFLILEDLITTFSYMEKMSTTVGGFI